jgi:hypothetical protein
MKYFKLLLISFLVFFGLFTLIGLLFPSSITTVRAVVVNRPKQKVFGELKISADWLKWYPYFFIAAGSNIRNADGDTTIFVSDKKELLLYNKKTDSVAVAFTLEDYNGNKTAQTIMALPISGDSTQTQVMWNETEHLKWYPWERFRGLVLEKTKGVFIDSALNRFKVYIEALK